MADESYFSVLGSVEVSREGQPVRLGGARLRTLLATLLLHANRPVSLVDIADRLWDTPPARARQAIQIYVVRLRQALGGRDLIHTDPGGYLIRASPHQLDLLRFEELLGAAARAADPQRRAALLGEALALWRGPVCADVTSDFLRSHDVAPILELRVDAEEQWMDAELAVGRHAARIPYLRRLVAEHPVRERFTAQLMLALYRSGRRADALEVYQRTRDLIVGELGVEPGAELQRLHGKVLNADPTLDAPGSTVAVRPVAQLPADSATFTGRSAELASILSLPGGRLSPTAVPICVIHGMAGVGKTALSVHAAHRLAKGFPDGQLFLDLHGFARNARPVHPGAALGRMLRSLGIPGESIPSDMDDRAALYRSILAGRRMLVVLDNARGEAQVAPLLPGTPGCLAIITSRRRLASLDATHTVALDVLSHSDAVSLLARGVRAAPSPALDDIVRHCGHLPLAIRIAAARLHDRPAWTVTYLAKRLGDSRYRLTELDAGERSLTAALDLSYQDLTATARRMLCVLALHPGSDIEPIAAAALINATPPRARRLLEELRDLHFLREGTPGRYRMPDLIRAYVTHEHNLRDSTPA